MSTELEVSGARWNLTEQRALELLGTGAAPEQVASAVGVSVSRISQLVSNPEFSAAVAELRFQSLSKHNSRDNKYDSMEDQLLEQLENLRPMMMRPMEVLKAIQVINAAKRRGASAPSQVTANQTVVNITLPQVIIDSFASAKVVTNSNNQVIKAGNQDLITMQSGALFKECKGDTDEILSERARINSALAEQATSRANALLNRAKNTIAGSQSSQSLQDLTPSFVSAGSQY